MKLFFNFLAIIFMFSFPSGCSSLGYQSPRYVKLAHEITEKTAKELKAQKSLYLVGTGGRMMHDIQMMAMSFYYYQEVNIKTARELTIYVVDEYLSAINSNKEVRPYLHEYPFTAKNIEIRIFIYKPDKSQLPPEKIYCIECMNGILEYYARSNPRLPICEETYEEALQKIDLLQGVTEKIGQANDKTSDEKIPSHEAVAKDGAKVSVDGFDYYTFRINGEGFKPYESLNYICNSYQKVSHVPIKADKNGKILPIGISSPMVGKSGGVCHINILRETDSIHLRIPWGTEALKRSGESYEKEGDLDADK